MQEEETTTVFSDEPVTTFKITPTNDTLLRELTFKITNAEIVEVQLIKNEGDEPTQVSENNCCKIYGCFNYFKQFRC